jgi:mono/diheme cytochrome c family protein
MCLLFAASPAGAGEPAAGADEAAPERGKVLFRAADCAACHTDVKGGGKPLSGGRPLDTPFGRIYGPNITADKTDGIGGWTEAQFHRALREGIDADGKYLFPVFPYTSFTGMTDQDIADLYGYLRTQPAAARPDRPNELSIPFRWRFLQAFWRSLFFTEGPLQPVASRNAQWNRGRYIAEAIAHCSECHTPRNFLGGLELSEAYSGNPHGPDGMKVPNITPDPETGIGKWTVDDVALMLKTGQTPDFDFVGSGMADVVKGTAALDDADRRAIAVYILSLPPIHRPQPAG